MAVMMPQTRGKLVINRGSKICGTRTGECGSLLFVPDIDSGCDSYVLFFCLQAQTRLAQ